MNEPGEAQSRIIPRSGPIHAAVTVPPSKSVTQRALIAAAMAGGESVLIDPLQADDSRLLRGALGKLGIPIRQEGGSWKVSGSGGRIPAAEASIHLENAGTAMRFLTPLVAIGTGTYTLDGSERMRSRPMGDLLSALSRLGVEAASAGKNGCPPVEIRAAGLPGGTVEVRGSVSSQFLSGLLLASPCARSPLTIRLAGPLVSKPYVDLTVEVMRAFGIEFESDGPEAYRVKDGSAYRPATYPIEGDASSAAWWMAAAAVTGGEARIRGLRRRSAQGDLRLIPVLEMMGCRIRWEGSEADASDLIVEGGALRGVEADLSDMPDAAPALAAVALFASSPTRIHGAPHLREKESDRIAGLASGLGSLGALVEEHRDGLTIRPGKLAAARLDPLDDHRLAMAFAVAGLGIGGVEILNPGCVAKSYPDFFRILEGVVS